VIPSWSTELVASCLDFGDDASSAELARYPEPAVAISERRIAHILQTAAPILLLAPHFGHVIIKLSRLRRYYTETRF
jgi:hypothetical protein